jgi:plasmid stability protein
MARIDLRDVPEDLYDWLVRRAESHHRSVEAEAASLLDSLCPKPRICKRRATVEEIMAVSRRGAALRVRDGRGDDEILGYGSDGVPE